MKNKSRKKIIEETKKLREEKENREKEKNIPSELEKKAASDTLYSFDTKRLDDKKKGFIEEPKRDKKKIGIRFVAVLTTLLLLCGTAIFSLRFIDLNIEEMLWKTSLTRGSSEINNKSVRYESFRNGLMRISNDGITYVNNNGKVKWTVSYNMKDPIYETKRKYFAVADRNGNEFCIFDETGLLGKNTTTYPIQCIALSEVGSLYILQADDSTSYINLYKKDSSIDNGEISTTLTAGGMPVDISTSYSGDTLLGSFEVLRNDSVSSKAVYMTFDSQNGLVGARTIGTLLDEFAGHYLAKVHYFDDEKSCLIYDGGIYFVNIDENNTMQVVKHHEFEARIKSISYNDSYIVFVFEGYRFMCLNDKGDVVCDKDIDFDYDNFYINDDNIIFICGKKVMIYDIKGRMIFNKETDKDVEYVAKRKNIIFTEFLFGLIDGIECIRFF